MTKIQLEQLIWDDWNTEHIKKHDVTVLEVAEAIQRIQAHKKGYHGRILLIGRSNKRILAIVVAPEKNKRYYTVSARDANKKERKLLYEKENK